MSFQGSLFVLDKDSKKKALYFSDSNRYFCLEVEQATDNDTLNKIHLGHTFVDSNNCFLGKKGRIPIAENISYEFYL